MSEIYFVELLNDNGRIYDSYRDELWGLVKLSGFKTCGLGDIDYQSDNIYICYLRNGNTHANFTHEQAKNKKCKIILWLLEWGKWKYENGHFYTQGFNLEPYWTEIWVSCRYYKQVLSQYNPKSNIRYVFLGGHPGFGGQPKSPKKWDFVTLAYAYGTRAHKIQILEQNGYTFAPNQSDCWGNEKENALAYARWGLALQQFNVPFLNSQRMVLFASWKLPIIVDSVKDSTPYKVFPEGLTHYNPWETICGDTKEMEEAVELNHFIVSKHKTFQSEIKTATTNTWYND